MKFNPSKILKEIKPSSQEEKSINQAVKEFTKKIKKDLIKAKANLVLGGSLAKGTWLKGNHDIDIFIQFREENNISETLGKILKKNFNNVILVHGSRDYFNIKFQDKTFEIVPVYKIKNPYQAKNVTDCSIFHIKWVAKHSNKKLKDEIRLVKQFCRAANVYGAETHISGFSGYVTEILTIYFGSFNKFVKGIISLNPNKTIDISKHKMALDKNKLSPIILIDPVQGNRNAAAALSMEKFIKLKKTCIEFLNNPNENFFKIQRKNPDKLKKQFDVVLELVPLEGKKDIVGTKIIKVMELIKLELNNLGFLVMQIDWDFGDPTYIWFNVKNQEIPKEYKHFGPPVKDIENANHFKEKYKNEKILTENNKLVVILKRKNYLLNDYLESLISSQYIRERVNKIKILKK